MNSRAGKIFAAAVLHAAIYLAFSVGGAAAQVQFDAAGSGAAFSNTGVVSLTWQHTVTAGGTNRALFVGVSTTTAPLPAGLPICASQPLLCSSGALPASASARVLSVTYNGAALQFVGFRASPDLNQAAEIYRLVAPAEGTNSVVVTFNPASVFQAVGGSTSYTGVSQTTPNGAFASANGTDNSPTVTVGDAVSGDVVLDALAVPPGATNAAVGALQTERYNGRVFFNNAYDLGAGSTEPGTATAVETMSWLTTNPSNWALAAVSVKQFVNTAASVTVGGRILTQTGRGVARARVTITDSNGASRTALTNFFGYFRFTDVVPGDAYFFNVSAKSHSFAARIVTISADLIELNFIAQP